MNKLPLGSGDPSVGKKYKREIEGTATWWVLTGRQINVMGQPTLTEMLVNDDDDDVVKPKGTYTMEKWTAHVPGACDGSIVYQHQRTEPHRLILQFNNYLYLLNWKTPLVTYDRQTKKFLHSVHKTYCLQGNYKQKIPICNNFFNFNINERITGVIYFYRNVLYSWNDHREYHFFSLLRLLIWLQASEGKTCPSLYEKWYIL